MKAGEPSELIDPKFYAKMDLADYIIFVERNGQELYASPNLALQSDRPKSSASIFGFQQNTYDLVHSEDMSLQTRVTVGILAGETRRSVQEIVLATTLLFLIAAAILIRTTFGAIHNALKPLRLFESEMEQRHSGNLSALDLKLIPVELVSVATSINALMGKLDAAIKQERQFVSNAAHELRTPLAGMIAQIDTIPDDVDRQETAECLAKIRGAAQRSSRMITQLLNHARAYTISDEIATSSTFDMRDLIEDVIGPHAQRVLDLGVDLGVDFQGATSMVCYPRDLLHIIIDNLFDNALKHCGDPGRVNVTVQAQGVAKISLQIEDDGKGLSQEQFQKACSRFERLQENSTSGFGLGLSLASDLCARLEIDLSSYTSPFGGLGVRIQLISAIEGAG
ncbi:MAG: sensor histidine kinase [Cognatishimia sp.]